MRIVEFVVHGDANLPCKIPNVPICGVSQTRLSFSREEVGSNIFARTVIARSAQESNMSGDHYIVASID